MAPATTLPRVRTGPDLASRRPAIGHARPDRATSRRGHDPPAAQRDTRQPGAGPDRRWAPPTNSAAANCQPISNHDTMPSSATKLVEAKHEHHRGGEVRVAGEQRLRQRRSGIRARRGHHSQEAAPPDRAGRLSPRAACICPRETNAFTAPRESETRDQRPQGFPERREHLIQAVPDSTEHAHHLLPARQVGRRRLGRPRDGGGSCRSAASSATTNRSGPVRPVRQSGTSPRLAGTPDRVALGGVSQS